MPYIDQFLSLIVRQGGSDLHVAEGQPPKMRKHGDVKAIRNEPVTRDEAATMMSEICGPGNWALFDDRGDLDFAYDMDPQSRFRCNFLKQAGGYGAVFRLIPTKIASLDELGIPSVVKEFGHLRGGLVLVTGPTGSGKSTTLAAIIDHINSSKSRHVVTIEDPIEYLHTDRNSIINQREVGMDTESFKRAMRRVLRQDPDVILIGEMRDEETVRSALSAAETGHLVMSTVHTLDAPETVNRIIDFFPLHEQTQARAMLAGTLKGVISQRLVPTVDGHGRVAVCEILRMTGRARDMILDHEQTGQLREVIAEGEYYGMQTFDQALLRHHQAGRVSMKDALRVATSPHDFKLLVSADGRTSTSMDDLKGKLGSSTVVGPVRVKPPTGVPPTPAAPSQTPSAPPPGVPA
jgi:twitching motility protein PilT